MAENWILSLIISLVLPSMFIAHGLYTSETPDTKHNEDSRFNTSDDEHSMFYFLMSKMNKAQPPVFMPKYALPAKSVSSVKEQSGLNTSAANDLLNLMVLQIMMGNILWNSTNITAPDLMKESVTDDISQPATTTDSLINAILDVLQRTITPAPTTSRTTYMIDNLSSQEKTTVLWGLTSSNQLTYNTDDVDGAEYTTIQALNLASNNQENFDVIRNISDVHDMIASENISDIQVDRLNLITTGIDSLVRTQSPDLHEVTHIMSQLSEVKETDSKTVQTYTAIFTQVIKKTNESETLQNDIEDIFPELMFAMENVLSATGAEETVSTSTSEIEVSTTIFLKNQTNMESSIVIETVVGTIIMPVTVLDEDRTRVSTIVYRKVHKTVRVVNHYKRAQIGSGVLSVSLQKLHNMTSERLEVNHDEAITLILPTNVNGKEKRRLCTFWNFKEGFWDTTGSELLHKNNTHTKCRYNHLTNFAVLVLYHREDMLSRRQKHALFVITNVGCSISIACLGVTLITYLYLRVLSNEKMLIHANLSVALMLAQFVLVTSQDTDDTGTACKIVAVLLHFLFMASFSWMLVEGVALYMACTRGLYTYGDMRMKYFLIGWGIPALVVVISVGVQFPNYGPSTDHSCWLSAKDGLIWAFMGPMLAVIFFNVFILGMVMRVFLTLRINSRKSESARFRASVKAMMTLVPLLGTTWILSLLVPFHAVFHFLFVIGNSMQGMMIFVLHCIFNEEVRKKMKDKRRQSNGVSASDTEVSELRPRTRKFLKFSELSVQDMMQNINETEKSTKM